MCWIDCVHATPGSDGLRIGVTQCWPGQMGCNCVGCGYGYVLPQLVVVVHLLLPHPATFLFISEPSLAPALAEQQLCVAQSL